MRSDKRWRASRAAFALVFGSFNAQAQSVTISVDRGSLIPLVSNFSGGNIASPDTPVELTDPAVQAFVRPIQTGVTRWPGGKVDDYFLWSTGLIPPPAGSPTAKTRPGVPSPIDILQTVFSPYPEIKFNSEVAKAITK